MRARALTLALLVLLLAAPSAFGHASLRGTVPERGAIVPEQPERVELRFSEGVEASFGAVQVFDAQARRVDDGDVTHPRGRSQALAVGLEAGLPDGTYTATYRLVSSDGHPVSGGVVFSIGAPGAGPAKTVDELIGNARAGDVTRGALDASRALSWAAIAGVVGGFVLLLRSGAALEGRGRRWLLAGAGMGVVASAGLLVLQGAVAGGTSAWSAVDPSVVRDVVGTRFGTVVAVQLGAFVGAAAVLLVGAPVRDLVVPAAVLVACPAFMGHAASQSPRGLLMVLDVLHVAAMALWLGGLAALLAVVPGATRALADPAARTPLLAGVLVRFSPVALLAVVVLLVTGTVQAIVHLSSVDDLWTTGFGRYVLLKAGLLAVLAGLGALHRRRTIPRLRELAAGGGSPGGAGVLLRRALRAEVALLLVVLGLTSVLVQTTPPATAAGGPVSIQRPLGPLDLTLTVDPAQPGVNELHVYLFRREDGTPFDGTKELTLTARPPRAGLPPVEVTVREAGPGHYVADAFVLSPGGTWRLDLVVRVSDFDQLETTAEVRVR